MKAYLHHRDGSHVEVYDIKCADDDLAYRFACVQTTQADREWLELLQITPFDRIEDVGEVRRYRLDGILNGVAHYLEVRATD